jgi:predicted dehydrogenase
MKKIKVAVIGTGRIAQNFHLPAYNKLPNVELAGVLDPDELKAKLIAEKYRIKNVYTDVDELLENDEIDAVDICTPTNTHMEFALKAINKKKHLFIEKPAGRTLDEVVQIRDAAKANDCKVMVAMNQRFRYDARLIKNYIQTGELGDLFYVQTGWLQKTDPKHWKQSTDIAGGGVVMDLGISLIDSLLWFYDFAELKAVKAKTFRHATKDVEDVCIATLTFSNGSIAQIEMSWSLFGEKSNFYCNVHGSKGSMKINPIEIFKLNGDGYSPDLPKDNLSKLEIYKKSYESEIKHFINTASGVSPLISSIDDAVKTMQAVELIYQSAAEGKEILL